MSTKKLTRLFFDAEEATSRKKAKKVLKKFKKLLREDLENSDWWKTH